ncbi:ketol-acid reductoisomerase [Candidatus Methanosphaera massiliense]|jgi:ketol-acid reductoisomerase|uniref:ketol-acid reductoisomerase n=1 Tax=Methanosphaera TaxID=2316 RepID=UPI000DC3677C|nr:ketol-acid reductoisomerase [Candidatus Methanosphaera massiliense]MDD6285851.1 ketol-acid reductoisomerase [Methanobacteriaceae archaeon]MDE4077984.1 ketol-acid reductoisomerase [Candidatus Methanosphaera massiliense]MDY2744371.1 ketol-acid reductoisomerase [Methanosphaera sp.]RAP44211.1 MAG: ketol-acid reductoisomerase [Methanosphaera sp. SHI1033]
MKVYYDDDVTTNVLKDKTIAVIGYGSQGHGQSLNMKDSGLNIVMGLREGGKSWNKAKEAGLTVKTIEEASKEADIIHILIPDEIQKDVYENQIKDNLEPGNTISFSHGYNIHFNRIRVPEDVNITMIAPKAPGSKVRETYLEGFGTPGLVAIEQDATGDAFDIAMEMAKAVGLTRAGVIETTYREETETDLFGEQAVLCGGLTALIQAGFETLVEAGYKPEMAYFETCHEMKLIVDLIYEKGFGNMWHDVSNTAEFGGLTRRDRIITDESKANMKEILKEIQNGTFATEFAVDSSNSYPKLLTQRRLEGEKQIEKVGKNLRIACGLEKEE